MFVIPSEARDPQFATTTVMSHDEPDYIRRLAGLCGLFGALLFFSGDMLFYGYIGSGASFADGMLATVQQASNERLFAGGLVGPLAAALCIVGFWHVYLNVKPQNLILGRLLFVSFFALMVAGSAVHTLWTAKGLALKYCYDQASPCADLLTVTKYYWTLAYNISAGPGYLGALLLFAIVLMRKTWYPRWTAVANPAVLILLSPLATKVPSPLGAILVGGSTNLAIAAFFFISVITTWARPTED
jgi:hypothetical protein